MKKPIIFTIILVAILLSLTYNLINTKLKLNNYYEISTDIHKISLKNKDIDNYINSTFSYSNFDYIEETVTQTEFLLAKIFDEAEISRQNKLVENHLFNVKNSLENKILILEKIESYRSILNNSFRLIQKVHDNIDNRVLTELYTIIMTIDKNENININKIEKDIKAIKPSTIYEEYFKKHLLTILNYNKSYKNLSTLSNELQTTKHIDEFINIYEKYSHDTILNAEISIIIVFIILVLLIIINLISSFRTIKTNLTLARFKSAVQNSDNIIMVTNKEHKINYVNDAFLNMTGYKKDEIIGKTPAVLKSGKLPKSHYENLNKTISSGKVWNGEFINYDKHGDLRYEKASIIPIFNDKNEISEYMAIKLDITEDIQKNEQLKEKDNMLAQQSKMAAMGEMLENIAHQWRQPLSAISSNSTSLIAQKTIGIPVSEEELIKTLNSINNSAQYLSETINSFRDFFKTDKEEKVFNLSDTCKKALSFVESKLKTKNINLIKNLNNDIKVKGIESELIQVIMNFYSNAIDILEEKTQNKYIIINVFKEKNHSIIKVFDSGGGISDDILNRVFEPYFTTKHQSQGTGIGLYMSREIIVKHFHGKIFVDNVSLNIENKNLFGAEFTIQIPNIK